MRDNEEQSLEKSLKYMAWNIKEISENIKKMTELMERQTETKPHTQEFGTLNNKELNLPF